MLKHPKENGRRADDVMLYPPLKPLDLLDTKGTKVSNIVVDPKTGCYYATVKRKGVKYKVCWHDDGRLEILT